MLGDIEELVKIFYEHITVLDPIAPLEMISYKNQNHKWYDQEIKTEIRKRDNAYKIAELINTEAKWNEYRIQRNITTNLIRSKKGKYYQIIIDKNKGNSKQMWKGIKEVMGGKNNKKIIENIYFGDENISEKEQIAQRFNTYFIRSIEDIINN